MELTDAVAHGSNRRMPAFSMASAVSVRTGEGTTTTNSSNALSRSDFESYAHEHRWPYHLPLSNDTLTMVRMLLSCKNLMWPCLITVRDEARNGESEVNHTQWLCATRPHMESPAAR